MRRVVWPPRRRNLRPTSSRSPPNPRGSRSVWMGSRSLVRGTSRGQLAASMKLRRFIWTTVFRWESATRSKDGSRTSVPLPAPPADHGDPGLKWIKLQFEASYRLIINLIDCPVPGQPCASAGRVQVDQAVYDRYTELWLAANASVNAKVFPNAGYIFTGWAQIPGGARPTSFDITFVMVEPGQLAPGFENTNSARVGSIFKHSAEPPHTRRSRSVFTSDSGMGLGDGPHSWRRSRSDREWHYYVFDSWSDGGDINHDVTVPNQTIPISFMARFVPAVFTTFSTSPAGLRLSIDGGLNFPNRALRGSRGPFIAFRAATQTDSHGQKYRFVSWSNGKPAAFDYVVGNTNERFTATYQPLVRPLLRACPPV